eukprot:scaffold2692_cov46-Phaeocystis_antarctica.AAC.2
MLPPETWNLEPFGTLEPPTISRRPPRNLEPRNLEPVHNLTAPAPWNLKPRNLGTAASASADVATAAARGHGCLGGGVVCRVAESEDELPRERRPTDQHAREPAGNARAEVRQNATGGKPWRVVACCAVPAQPAASRRRARATASKTIAGPAAARCPTCPTSPRSV